ncbi:AB hydrolase superfamily protein C4A8.06c [Hypsizygus marmoreus]|uniref:AB hydrolase superfamily protein C4A8.06c n=1 Tax=Hypsizygus marmoreus TaxID=39966 RepID=A0A369JQW4_HYPMA|nr:AB hydrolase superfamily protein C4A8.06c [Hypsizygus marmoreus]
MPVTTVSSAVHIAPVVVKTFYKHGKRKAKKLKEGRDEEEALDDIFFDEAFHIVKAFIKMGTKNTVESLQAFTNTHVPAPYWAAVSPVIIPLTSCNRAADMLIEWFGPDELKRVVGGERWWQVRGLDGVDGEWITEKEYLRSAKDNPKMHKNLNDDEADILRMDHLERVMLYVHGGGYFWGSVNTHRYQIIRYARKMKGRAFAVNYRKAPQYPWPCPLQDVLAAYLYLTQPPPGALHSAIPASKIVLAGDSAGGGLCLTVLTILRDLGLPMPAGAVLISPWVDLTHSFPSVMHNIETDIIPQHGFLAKPSTLWPVDPIPKGDGRVVPAKSNRPPDPGHTDTLKPTKKRMEENGNRNDITITKEKVKTQGEMLDAAVNDQRGENASTLGSGGPMRHPSSEKDVREDASDYDVNFWEPKPPKVLMEDPDAIPLELRAQIQLYATTEQLTHPLVSPILQGSLGNLPPLYILAGDGEVLRDEIIYLAHRAAHPSKYPARQGVLRDGVRQKENSEKFTTPTKVHLQVYDDMCHVLTVFSFTHSASCAYRSIAEFAKHVSDSSEEHLQRNPFPELHRPPSEISTASEADDEHPSALKHKTSKKTKASRPKEKRKSSDPSDVKIYKQNEANVFKEVQRGEAEKMPPSHSVGQDSPDLGDCSESEDIPNIRMIRERVNIHGISRPMEPPEDIQALRLRPGQIGIIKEAPTVRWLKGQEKWDKHFKSSAKRALKRRARLEAKARRLLRNARAQGLVLAGEQPIHEPRPGIAREDHPEKIQEDRRWGPLDLEDERPPPTAIAKRLDTPEALALLKKSVYYSPPVSHQTIPKLKKSDVLRATFDPNDDPNRPPPQSVSEQQVRTHIIPVHGLRMWDGIVRYFGRKSASKAVKGTKQVGKQLGIINSHEASGSGERGSAVFVLPSQSHFSTISSS